MIYLRNEGIFNIGHFNHRTLFHFNHRTFVDVKYIALNIAIGDDNNNLMTIVLANKFSS